MEMRNLFPEPERIEHYGAIIRSVAVGTSTNAILDAFAYHPSSRNYQLPSLRTLLRWLVLFSRLFLEYIKDAVKGKCPAISVDEWTAPYGGGIVGKV